MSALDGGRIVNTRAVHQAAALDIALRDRGAHPVLFPCIEILPPCDPEPLADALDALARGSYDWVVFTSVNAVCSVVRALGAVSIPSAVRIAAIGDGTADAIQSSLHVDSMVLPNDRHARGIAAALPVAPGERVLLPGSSIARPELSERLRERGAAVSVISAYRTTAGTGGADLAPLLARRELDGIAFASPSAVDGFVGRLNDSGGPVAAAHALPVACIGQTTAGRARERGFCFVSTSSQQTVSGLVDALETALAPFRKGVLRCP